ncbi:MAG TPA: peptide-methionine (S)-S-oxide reductase MsrA [Candidatus Saccharimonadales bacterium]|nr:peptide-methionine (S)-S-oxide reductase MsrA [Candidatus Saccharimonadales bacterium]
MGAKDTANTTTETIVLGGGCFWCLDASYKLVKGVTNVEEGYSGGDIPNPTDEQIYYENTGHAEVVRVTFDPNVISLDDILEIFWTIHDPTTLNRQGYDVGPEYRSIIFYVNNSQKDSIEKSKQAAQKVWDDPIVTEVVPFKSFYPASAYHRDYEINRPDYCHLIINPKLKKLREKFAEKIA